jgi:type IV secretory pathway VirB3-like protein
MTLRILIIIFRIVIYLFIEPILHYIDLLGDLSDLYMIFTIRHCFAWTKKKDRDNNEPRENFKKKKKNDQIEINI